MLTADWGHADADTFDHAHAPPRANEHSTAATTAATANGYTCPAAATTATDGYTHSPTATTAADSRPASATADGYCSGYAGSGQRRLRRCQRDGSERLPDD